MSRGQKDIAYRLELSRLAQGVSVRELYEETGITPSAWSNYINPNEIKSIKRDVAFKLKDRFGWTIEWIYDADRNRLPGDLLRSIAKLEREGGVDLTTRKRGPKSVAARTAVETATQEPDHEDAIGDGAGGFNRHRGG